MALVVVAALLGVLMVALAILFTWPWRIEATLKATTTTGAAASSAPVSLAGGVDVVGLALSASAAAILGGPGVAVIHLRGRERWRRSIVRVDLDAFFDWLDSDPKKEEDDDAKKKSLLSRFAHRTKDELYARTDRAGLLGLGRRIFVSLRDVSLRGSILFGASDPLLVGKTAAWLYPIAGMLAPFGRFDVSFDWTGQRVLNGDLEVSFRVVPARVALEGLRFARHHIHWGRRGRKSKSPAPPTATIASSAIY